MDKYLLTICIPTYNYGEYISETLSSLIKQIDNTIEVIIGDSASTDNTKAIVDNFIKKNRNIKYYNFQKKSGIDIDISKTVEKASGKYCWLLSSDDIVVANGVNKILQAIKDRPNVIIANRIICNKDMVPIKKNVSWLNKNMKDSIFDFNEIDSLNNYLKSLNSIGGLFSYMSVLIFKKKDWITVDNEKKYIFKCYSHAYNLFQILKLKNSKLKYLSSNIIMFRGFNDSFATDGYINRILIDLNGYKLLQEHLFPSGIEKKLFLKTIKKEHPWYYLIRLKYESNSKEEWKLITSKLKYFYYSKFEIKMIYMLGSSTIIMSTLRQLKQFFRV